LQRFPARVTAEQISQFSIFIYGNNIL